MNEPGVVEPLRSARWDAVAFLAEKNAKDMAAPQPNLPFLLVAWFRQIEIFHDAETERIIGGSPTDEERQAHRQALAMLIWQGESLGGCLREHDVSAQVAIKLSDVEAALEELYDRQRVFYGGMTEERRAQVLNEVFGAS
jgi:hypothetical protein